MKIIISEAQYRRLLNEFNDKYSSYKSGWVKVNYETIGCYELTQPLSVDVFLFPNPDVEDEYNGFLIDLKFNDKLIGQFHSYLDEDMGGLMNDIEISSEYQGKGLGKVLTLIAMCVSETVFGFYSSDVRGLTTPQKKVYSSLERAVYDKMGNIDYSKAQEVINQITRTLS